MTSQINPLAPSHDFAPTDRPILLVDDDPALLMLLRKSLGLQGHSALSAQSGEAAIALAKKVNPTLIILDVSMPGLNGFEICEHLKQNDDTCKIPIMFLSGSQIFEDKLMGLKLGAVDFISKPVEFQELNARVGTQLKLRRIQVRLEALHERTESLLLNVLPRSVADRLRNGECEIVDRFPEATILFCDLVGFTPMAAQMDPVRLVALLNSVFSEIDCLVEKHGLEKIKTIGDAYMAASGVPDWNPDHARAMANFALELRYEMVRVEREIPIRFRIGIHSGEVVAGIIGTKRFSFDLWGDTVNTASRMESSCAPMHIHVSSETRALLGDNYEFTPRGKIFIRGKGMFETYYLNRKVIGQPRSLPPHHQCPGFQQRLPDKQFSTDS